MQLDTLKRHTKHARIKRVGRGGKRGTYSGRGIKGQGAHAGRSPRPELRDIIKKIPKRRGYGKNRSRTVHDSSIIAQGVNVAVLEKHFASGETVTPAVLLKKGLLRTRGGLLPKIKILGAGELTKKLTIEKARASAKAIEKITAAGGTVVQ